jgi:aconitate hydratase
MTMTGGAAGGAGGPFGAWKTIDLPGGAARVAGLRELAAATGRDLSRLPYSVRVLLENGLRFCGRGNVEERDVLALLDWDPTSAERPEFAFMPARVLLQDFTGVPCVVDLAAMRSAVAAAGGDPAIIDTSVPVDLVIDHSVQVDHAGVPEACRLNMEKEMARNGERYALLRWAQGEFGNLRVIPPGAGICHQVNLEYLAQVVRREGPEGLQAGGGAEAVIARVAADLRRDAAAARRAVAPPGAARATALPWAYPDTVIGTDSHTTMINGLGVLGWGVGGIEAEAVMLGQPYFMLVPQVVGVRLAGRLAADATATDLVLTVTELLRQIGVVNRFVEYFGPGAEALTVADRATVANMSPEYGATCGFFPVDGETLAYLRQTGRPDDLCARVDAYCREQYLFRRKDSPDPEYSWVVELDLADVRPSLAGPRRPQERVLLEKMPERFHQNLLALAQGRTEVAKAKVEVGGKREFIHDGDVVIASITSCTNTSNPALMLAAGLVARNAAALGLKPKPWVRTSLAPGSRAVTGYLADAGLLEPLEALGFGTVGYGCATCIGNSGPLPDDLSRAIKDDRLVVAAVLSGNRNFEARIHSLVRANYLASPPLVVAFALAGTVDIDLVNEPLGTRGDGRPVYLADLWPTAEEVADLAAKALRPDLFRQEYAAAVLGTQAWQLLEAPAGALYEWDPDSTYVRQPPFFAASNGVSAAGSAGAPAAASAEPTAAAEFVGARILAILGDSVTTDHISPAGSIGVDTPAGKYLLEQGVQPADFNTYGARRGNHEILMRGTFANVRLKNHMAGGREGGWTTHHPSGELLPIFDAAMRYQADGVPLVVFAGKEYGSGSSRDWAAKGPALLGVKVVIAESFERIHRSNLVGMGILPLELEKGVTVESLGLDGSEVIDTAGVGEEIGPGADVLVAVHRTAGEDVRLTCKARLDSSVDVDYYTHGGVLPRMLQLKMNGAIG